MIRGFGGRRPTIDPSAFVAETATVVGDVTLPEGLEATLALEAFVAGDVGETAELTLTGLRAGSWQRTIHVPWDKLVWTGCGEDANMRINTSLRTRGNADAKLSIGALTVYRLVTKAC